MTFYESQHKARRKTGILLGYFVLAVICIVIAVNAAIYLTLMMSDAMGVITLTQWIQSPLGWGTALITLAVIGGGSLVRYMGIKSGGDAVAAMVGGRLILPDTSDQLEKRLLNIAEEMAIASGTHVPRVYLLEKESGINAFVAGYNTNNTILAVTRGALDNLTRDELQGVIGHEYSHILNADTRINLHLIAILAGILVIGQIGEHLLRSGRHRSYSSRKNNNGGAMVLGLALMAIGYVGLFFGRLIKAAISRQREFLADASAVQFTRNPFGIGGALFKIGALTQGSHLQDRHAEEMSHMCFGETLHVGFSKMLATHPPIDERLHAIDPSLPTRMKSRLKQGQLKLADEQTAFAAGGGMTGSLGVSGFHVSASQRTDLQETPSTSNTAATNAATGQTQPDIAATQPFAADADHLKQSVGQVTPEHVQQAQAVMAQVPDSLRDLAHRPQAAECILYALILTTMNTHGKPAMSRLQQTRSPQCATHTREAYYQLRELPDAVRLPLLDIALATLESLEQTEKNSIVSLTRELIDIDTKFTLYEFIYFSLVEKYLGKQEPNRKIISSWQPVINDIAVLLAAVVLASGNSPENQQTIFLQTLRSYTEQDFSAMLVRPPSLESLQEATQKLNRLSPLLKQPLIDACVDCILHDFQVTTHEANLLRAICERLDCPMPMITPATATRDSV